MAPSWPRPSAAVRELFRQAAVQALDVQPEWMDELHAASLSGVRMQPIAEDPVLAAAVRRANVANLRHWATANVRRPAERVSVDLGPDILDGARDLVRRGLDTGALDAYRSAQGVAWRRWMGLCFALHAGSAELEELLDVSALSITTFIEDTVAAMSVRMAAERAELTVGMHADRRAVVSLVLEGAPLPRARAEAQLGYGLTGPHTAAVVWTRTGAAAAHQLEAATEAVTRLCSAPLRLTVVAGASVLWVWLPVPVAPSARELAASLLATPDVRIALGRPGDGVDGFRRSHLDATTAQRMLTGPTSEQQVASYDDVRLVALLSSRQGGLDEFTAEVLGRLQTADADLRDTVSTYVRELGSATRTAERLYTHRNTVLRRLTRADELLPRPLAQDPVTVAAALELVRWRGAPS